MSWVRNIKRDVIGTAGTTVPSGSQTASFTIPANALCAYAAFSEIEEVDVELDGASDQIERVSGGWSLLPPLGFVAPIKDAATVKFEGVSAANTVTLYVLTS